MIARVFNKYSARQRIITHRARTDNDNLFTSINSTKCRCHSFDHRAAIMQTNRMLRLTHARGSAPRENRTDDHLLLSHQLDTCDDADADSDADADAALLLRSTVIVSPCFMSPGLVTFARNPHRPTIAFFSSGLIASST